MNDRHRSLCQANPGKVFDYKELAVESGLTAYRAQTANAVNSMIASKNYPGVEKVGKGAVVYRSSTPVVVASAEEVVVDAYPDTYLLLKVLVTEDESMICFDEEAKQVYRVTRLR